MRYLVIIGQRKLKGRFKCFLTLWFWHLHSCCSHMHINQNIDFFTKEKKNYIRRSKHNRSEWKHEVKSHLSKNKSEASAKTQSKSEVQLFIPIENIGESRFSQSRDKGQTKKQALRGILPNSLKFLDPPLICLISISYVEFGEPLAPPYYYRASNALV